MIRLFILAIAVMLGAIAGVVIAEAVHGKKKPKPKEPEWGSEQWQVAYLENLYVLEARQ